MEDSERARFLCSGPLSVSSGGDLKEGGGGLVRVVALFPSSIVEV